MNPEAPDPRLIDALGRATSLELFQLSAVIERLLSDPRRILAVRIHMNLGQTVRFLDPDTGQMRDGTVIAMKDTQVTLRDERTQRERKLPYAAVEPPLPASGGSTQAPQQQGLPSRGDFRRGDRVSFDDRYLQAQVGTIVRINERTATIDTGDGLSWRVSFALLRRVVDI